jgi:hypothetical protein
MESLIMVVDTDMMLADFFKSVEGFAKFMEEKGMKK